MGSCWQVAVDASNSNASKIAQGSGEHLPPTNFCAIQHHDEQAMIEFPVGPLGKLPRNCFAKYISISDSQPSSIGAGGNPPRNPPAQAVSWTSWQTVEPIQWSKRQDPRFHLHGGMWYV